MATLMGLIAKGSFGLSVVSVALAATLIVLGIWTLYARIPEEDREFKDPLGPRLTLVWPVIRVLEYYVYEFLE